MMEVSPNSIEYLILEGAAEISGIDLETGEAMYTFTDKLADINPKLHQELNNYIYGATMILWTKGYLEIDLMSEEPLIRPTEKAYADMERIGLADREIAVLDNILNLFTDDAL